MSEITNAIKQVCEEKSLSYDAVVATIESALAAAYRKDYGEKNQNIKVEYNPSLNKSRVFDVKTVVEDLPEGFFDNEEKEQEEQVLLTEEEDSVEGEEKRRFNPKTEIQLSDAQLIDSKYKIGDEVKIELEVKDEYGRMAAQTAKQVVIQKLREAERNMVFDEFKEKEKEVVTGVVQRKEGRFVLVDLGKISGIILPEDQVKGERYNPGDRLKVYVKEVKVGIKGVEILLSRTSEEILKKVFYLEIPEISNGLIQIKAVSREAGFRSKVAVYTDKENIDPIGSCVGQRGSRIQTIINELGGEKIDIIEYNDDPEKYIANSLAPAKIISVELNKDNNQATIMVPEDQLSLAIGKDGQNVRLAAHLTGWKIDILTNSSNTINNDIDDLDEENGKEHVVEEIGLAVTEKEEEGEEEEK